VPEYAAGALAPRTAFLGLAYRYVLPDH